ncbi:MAG: hypothetical protein II777_08765 [Clostridia bacterium]|nr:hypothetical protein [Clostridia bacterium]
MATDKTHFRTSLSGFNKADVLEYLDRQNADFMEESRRSAAALEEKSKKLEELTAEAERLRSELEGAKAACKEAEEKVSGLEAQLTEAKNALAESEAVIASQTELIEDLRSRVDASCAANGEKAAEAERKAELYDGVSSQLGDILIAANKNAEEIIENANRKADKIKEEAVLEAELSRDEFSSAMDKCTAAFSETAARISGLCCGDIGEELSRVRESVDRVLLELQKSSGGIAEKARQTKSDLDAELKKSLDGLDAKISELRKK